MYFAGLAKLHLGKYEQAVTWFRRAIETHRSSPLSHFQLGAALAGLGQFEEARSAVKAGLTLNPDFSITRAQAAGGALSADRTYLTQFERNLDGMRKAGVPEQ